MKRETVFSPCRKYRYTLWREWGCDLFEGDGIVRDRPFAMFIGLNPSTADETQDDPTIRRCIGYAKVWGFSALCMTNLFAWRETDSRLLAKVPEPIGPDNDRWLNAAGHEAGVIVAAWGTKGELHGRGKMVEGLLRDLSLKCLRKTGGGYPEHPLYLPKTLTPIDL